MARFVPLLFIIGFLPSGLAGPACAQKHKTASDCILKCNTKWGFPGFMMGTDPWGSVMHRTGVTAEDWDTILAKACNDQAAKDAGSIVSSDTSSPTDEATRFVHQGLATAVVPTPSPSSTSSRFTSSRLTTSTTSRHTSTTSPTSSKPAPTTTKTTPKTTTTTHNDPPANTPQSFKGQSSSNNNNNNNNGGSQSNSNSGNTNKSSSNSNSNTGNSGNSNSNGNSNGNTGSNGNAGTNTGSSSNSGGGNGGDNGSRASDADVQAYLNAHNKIRAQHGAVPVTWSNSAAEKAQEWADKCLNVHSGGSLGPLGENLAAGTGSFAIADAVKAWTDEVSEYDSSNPQPSHFTQVVWKATTQIGCAVQTCDGIFQGFGPAQYYVCEYFVQGNVIGDFGANVQA